METYPCPACGGTASAPNGCRACGRPHDPDAAALALFQRTAASLEQKRRDLNDAIVMNRRQLAHVSAQRDSLRRKLRQRIDDETSGKTPGRKTIRSRLTRGTSTEPPSRPTTTTTSSEPPSRSTSQTPVVPAQPVRRSLPPGPTSSPPGPTSSPPGPTSSPPGPTSGPPRPTSAPPGPTSAPQRTPGPITPPPARPQNGLYQNGLYTGPRTGVYTGPLPGGSGAPRFPGGSGAPRSSPVTPERLRRAVVPPKRTFRARAVPTLAKLRPRRAPTDGPEATTSSMQAAVLALGQSLRVLALAPDDGAALVAADVHIGRHDDITALRDFAKGCDVVTFDHEHVPGELIRILASEGVTVLPSADSLRYAQSKRAMRERLSELGVPVPRWSAGDVNAFAAEVGWPVVVKAVSGGYDGRGVFVVSSADEIPAGIDVIVEQRVSLRRELAAVVARSPFGQVAAYPIVETVQRDGICVEVLAPAPDLDPQTATHAQKLAIDIAVALDVVGILAVELFETPDGLLVNELAMRPHNSAHWTIEGARTSQFEQHVRAVLDYPLGDTALTAPAVVMANVLGGEPGGMPIDERLHHLFAEEPGAKVHLYGKQPRPGRKLGHVTVLGNDLTECRARADRARRWLSEGAHD